MRLLHPTGAESRPGNVEAAAAETDRRWLDRLYGVPGRISRTARPWLMVNMVASIDGATALDGLSGGLGGEADRQAFSAIRAIPDIVLVASGTAIAEDYQPIRVSEDRRADRVGRGQNPLPRLAIVTGSVRIDLETPLFRAPEPPLIIAPAAAPADRLEAAQAITEVIIAGDERVDPAMALAELGQRGASIVLSEGGPSFNGQLVEADLVDEFCLTLSPQLLGGEAKRAAVGPRSSRSTFRLAHAVEHEDTLLLRYLRDEERPAD